jgi:hypothetical protein
MRLRPDTHRSSGSLWFAILFALLLVSFPTVPRADGGKPLSQQEILELLQGGVSSSRVSSIVDDRGINFGSTDSFEQRVRSAGGSNEVIDSVRRASQKYEETSRPQTGGLVIKSTPGEAEVYLNDELRGMTSPEGEIRIPGLPAGDFKLRVSSIGFKSFEQTITVAAGEDQTVYVTLVQRTTPGRNLPPSVDPNLPATALSIPGIKIEPLKFFEGPFERTLDKADRVYQTSFDRQAARSIYWEVDLAYPPVGRHVDFTLDADWYHQDGTEFHHQTLNAHVESDWRNSWHTVGYGWKDGGNWQQGVYRVEISFKGVRLSTGTFQIY